MRFTHYHYFPFFVFIHYMFGLNIIILLKKWIHYNKELVKIVTPTETNICYIVKGQTYYLNILINIVHWNLSFIMTSQRAETFINSFILKMLNLEITANLKHCKRLITFIYWLTRTIENNLSRHMCIKFLNSVFTTKIVYAWRDF